MTGRELKALRERLGMTQQTLAEALRVSFPTLNRWENGERSRAKIPQDTAKMLHCLDAYLDEIGDRLDQKKVEEIREAAKQAGVEGVLSAAAAAKRLSPALAAALVSIPAFTWLGGLMGVGIASALSYFAKLARNAEDSSKSSPKSHRGKHD